jgi:hypothetical protein
MRLVSTAFFGKHRKAGEQMRSASRVVEVRAQEPCDYASIVTISNVSGSAVRNRDVNRDHPRARRPSDHPTIDHRERLWDRARKIAPRHLRNFPQKKLEASPPADVPPSRRAHQERRGEFAMRLF